jgi:hypothetical protein
MGPLLGEYNMLPGLTRPVQEQHYHKLRNVFKILNLNDTVSCPLKQVFTRIYCTRSCLGWGAFSVNNVMSSVCSS